MEPRYDYVYKGRVLPYRHQPCKRVRQAGMVGELLEIEFLDHKRFKVPRRLVKNISTRRPA